MSRPDFVPPTDEFYARVDTHTFTEADGPSRKATCLDCGFILREGVADPAFVPWCPGTVAKNNPEHTHGQYLCNPLCPAFDPNEGKVVTNASANPITEVDHPQHYGGDTPYEAIKVIEAWDLGFNLGNTVKYIARADHKGTPLKDLMKAQWYLTREIERRSNGD